jgi:predicted nucleic acid binding AN1-type Zn finger protein
MQDPPKFSYIGIFGLKIYDLATLCSIKSSEGGYASKANPTIVSCNASAVKTYNATSSLVRFGKK